MNYSEDKRNTLETIKYRMGDCLEFEQNYI